MIAAHGLTKVFRDRRRGEFRAVDDVSFTVEPGRIYGLLGANGAGKTTTLRLLATLLRPTAGTAEVAGRDINLDPAGVRARVGFLATSTALYGRLTAREHRPAAYDNPNGLDAVMPHAGLRGVDRMRRPEADEDLPVDPALIGRVPVMPEEIELWGDLPPNERVGACGEPRRRLGERTHHRLEAGEEGLEAEVLEVEAHAFVHELVVQLGRGRGASLGEELDLGP